MVVAKKQIKPGRVIDTLADIGSLVMSVIYALYVTLLLIFDLGTIWLNYGMLCITILYFIFFVLKIVIMNKIFEANKAEKLVRVILKYTKWSMKLINAVFVILVIITAQQDEGGGVLMLVGVFIVLMSFVISVLWDIGLVVVRKRFAELWQGWDRLSKAEKDNRVKSFVAACVSSIDTIAGVNIAQSLAIGPAKEGKAEEDDDD